MEIRKINKVFVLFVDERSTLFVVKVENRRDALIAHQVIKKKTSVSVERNTTKSIVYLLFSLHLFNHCPQI